MIVRSRVYMGLGSMAAAVMMADLLAPPLRIPRDRAPTLQSEQDKTNRQARKRQQKLAKRARKRNRQRGHN